MDRWRPDFQMVMIPRGTQAAASAYGRRLKQGRPGYRSNGGKQFHPVHQEADAVWDGPGALWIPRL
jgi:hypothetical protein